MEDNKYNLCMELSRRELLQSSAFLGTTAGTSVGMTSFASSALAEGQDASSNEVTIRQGGEVVDTVVPFSAEGMDVREFYRNGAPTEDGVSQLFFYEHEGRLSLVALHDASNSSSGGSVQLTFEGLPDDGEWTVQDDRDHPPDEYAEDGSYAKWRWYRCCTDGGAYTWPADEDVEVTITPRPYHGGSGDPFSGIHTWKLRSGDGRSTTLSPDQPVTASIGAAGPVDGTLGWLIDEKNRKIASIRGAVPGEWESDRSRIDSRAEQFLETAEEVRDTGSPAERNQYEEALNRLNDSEDLMLGATRGPLSNIIPKTATLVIKAALALATEGIGQFARYNVKDRAIKFVQDRILGSARAVKDRTVHHFETGEWGIADPDEFGTLFDEGYFTLARFFDETIGRNPDPAERYFEEVTASGVAIGSFGVAQTDWGIQLQGAVENAYDTVETALNGLLYRLYYHDISDPQALDAVPDFSLPSDLDSYSIDVPGWISELSDRIPDEVSIDDDLPLGSYSDTLSDLNDTFTQAQPYLNLVDFPAPDVGSSGINAAMEDSVEALAADAEAGRLDETATEARSEAASTFETVLDGANEVFSTAFWIYEQVSDVLAATTVAAFVGLIGLMSTAVVVGTEASLLIGGVTVGTAISQLLSALYVLGWVELIFIAAQGLTLVAAVLFFQQTFAAGTLVVNNLPDSHLEGI